MGAPEEETPTVDDLRAAQRVAGLDFSEEKLEMMLKGVRKYYENYQSLNQFHLDNGQPPALGFDPRPIPPYYFSPDYPPKSTPVELERPSDVEMAYLPLTHLSHLLKSRQVTSTELTQLYLSRLKTYDQILECVITITEDLALSQADQADRELDQGKYRGLLHGVPYGIKDLFSHPDYPTTWGAMPFKDQKRSERATVVSKLEKAGAVMLAKLSLGALAWGDVWFGGHTKSPYNTDEGSSGSSAGSAAAVSAGLVGFAIGTETWGSIVSPSTRCGATGLRPTFGRVSRYGVMSLAWSMDKVGPICRTVEDCALVFDVINGPDGKDPSVISKPFAWNYMDSMTKMNVGYDPDAFDLAEDDVQKKHDQATLDKLRELGHELQPISMPEAPLEELSIILSAEAATAFEELTRTGRDDLMVRQEEQAWPNVFRQARMIPAVEYIRANRVRRILMGQMQEILTDIDVYLAPSFSKHLLLTNLTGHPAVVVPNGFRENGLPTSITFIGNLFKESHALHLAKTYQDATSFHLRRPQIDL